MFPPQPKNDELTYWITILQREMREQPHVPAEDLDTPDIRQEVIEKGAVTLGREGYCALACRMIHSAFGVGQPLGFRDDEFGGIAHHFLMIHSKAFDLGGPRPSRVLKAYFPGKLRTVRISWNEVDKAIAGLGMKPVESRAVRLCFSAHIQENLSRWENWEKNWESYE